MTTSHSLLLLLCGLALSQTLGCSLLLDTTECNEDADCTTYNAGSIGYVCNTNINECVPIDTDANVLEGTLVGDTTLKAGNTYTLRGLVYVEQPFKLTIEAGTTIKGEEGSALIIKRGAQLVARGNANEPIVFTSAQPEGERSPGDWGGIALLGSAKVNIPNAILEGVSNTTQVAYGGEDDESTCGVLEYVRVEFGGFAIKKDNELNGLTLAGCGNGTIVDHVQVHLGKDDGIEIFGGTVDLRHVLITRAQDDSLDWDQGWRGTAQFIAIQQDASGDNAIEADNLKANNDASPRSFPRLYNLTFIGAKDAGAQRAITFKEGTSGLVANSIMLGHRQEAIDIKGTATVAQAQANQLQVSYSLFFDQGAGGKKFFPTPEEETERMPGDQRDDDGGFDEASHFTMEMYNNIFDVNPQLKAPFDLKRPDFTPKDDATISNKGIAPPPGFDESANYLGAFAPNSPPWSAQWTAFPEN